MSRNPLDSAIVKDRKRLGSRLLCYREAAGLTQEEIAGKSGFSRVMISFFEKGLRGIPAKKEKLLALAYGFSRIDDFNALKNDKDSRKFPVETIYNERINRQKEANESVIIHFEPHEAYHARKARTSSGGNQLELQTVADLMKTNPPTYRFCMPEKALVDFKTGIMFETIKWLKTNKQKNTEYAAKQLLKKWQDEKALFVYSLPASYCLYPTVIYDPTNRESEGWVWFGPHTPNRITSVSNEFLLTWEKEFYKKLVNNTLPEQRRYYVN